MPPLTVGMTPLYRTDRLAAGLGLQHVWVKDDGRNPSASFKDRASAVAVIKAQEKGAEIITTSSTGNAGAALSALCASVGQPNVVFVPESAPPAKVAQLLVYGSTVILVRGSYDDAFELCGQAAKEFGWYNRNTGYNPYMSEGKKTASFEICEQLGWDAPDWIVVSVGDGCVIGGVYKGLFDMYSLGWIKKMPKLLGVQAAGSAALYDAWVRGIDAMAMQPIEAKTVADSISADLPADRIKGAARGAGDQRRVCQGDRRRDPGCDPGAGAWERRVRRTGRRGRVCRIGPGHQGRPDRPRRARGDPVDRQRPEGHRVRAEVGRRALRRRLQP